MPKNRGRLSLNWTQIKDSVGVKHTMVLFTFSIPSMSVGGSDVLVSCLCFVVLSGSTREEISLCQDFLFRMVCHVYRFYCVLVEKEKGKERRRRRL